MCTRAVGKRFVVPAGALPVPVSNGQRGLHRPKPPISPFLCVLTPVDVAQCDGPRRGARGGAHLAAGTGASRRITVQPCRGQPGQAAAPAATRPAGLRRCALRGLSLISLSHTRSLAHDTRTLSPIADPSLTSHTQAIEQFLAYMPDASTPEDNFVQIMWAAGEVYFGARGLCC
jgi:hypothetical protein